jgi:hypothetical protein
MKIDREDIFFYGFILLAIAWIGFFFLMLCDVKLW